ncbi:MAG TPA: alanine racemase [Candidatus Hydrogenedentes bacterium]|nr:alanine racemase [Candidatus Hydrogenedentota bacterium]
MSRVTVNIEALSANLEAIDRLMTGHGAAWTLVTKVLCGNTAIMRVLASMGVRSVGESRLTHLRAVRRVFEDPETWYLRIPRLSMCNTVVTMAHVSLNSEIETIARLNEAAAAKDKVHRVVIMIELGDLREGILPGSLIAFYDAVFRLPHIEVIGIGTNLGCLAGVPPTVDQLMQLVLYRELLELKFNKPLPLISAGSSVVLPLLVEGQVPKAINHFRIGEALFLGSDLVHGGTLPGFRDDVMLLDAEIVELKEKGMAPIGESGVTSPFQAMPNGDAAPGQRGYRALVSMGQLDTEITGLTPTQPDYQIVGASSDITVVNIGENPRNLRIGDTVTFRMNYAALLRLMSSRYVTKEIIGTREDG